MDLFWPLPQLIGMRGGRLGFGSLGINDKGGAPGSNWNIGQKLLLSLLGGFTKGDFSGFTRGFLQRRIFPGLKGFPTWGLGGIKQV